MRTVVVIIFATLLLSGCYTEDRNLQVELNELNAQIKNLQDQVRTLEDSLWLQSNQIRAWKDRFAQQEKLKHLLLDNQVGIWRPDSQASSVHFAEPVAATNAEELVQAFNAAYPGSSYPEIELLTVRDAVARVRIKDAEQLTERMGSTGSKMYLTTATFSLTSLCRIDSVYFQFKEGSHAKPGYFSRADLLMLADIE